MGKIFVAFIVLANFCFQSQVSGQPFTLLKDINGGIPYNVIRPSNLTEKDGLLFFNIGVEIGQLVFVAAVLSVISLLRHAASRLLEPAPLERALDRLDVTVGYAIGVVAAYWLVERTTAFFV